PRAATPDPRGAISDPRSEAPDPWDAAPGPWGAAPAPRDETPHPRAAAADHPLPESPGGLRMLLAEDNRVNQVLAARLLEKQGHTVVVVGSGLEVLAALEARPSEHFDMVLMDVQMPEMDGFAAT